METGICAALSPEVCSGVCSLSESKRPLLRGEKAPLAEHVNRPIVRLGIRQDAFGNPPGFLFAWLASRAVRTKLVGGRAGPTLYG